MQVLIGYFTLQDVKDRTFCSLLPFVDGHVKRLVAAAEHLGCGGTWQRPEPSDGVEAGGERGSWPEQWEDCVFPGRYWAHIGSWAGVGSWPSSEGCLGHWNHFTLLWLLGVFMTCLVSCWAFQSLQVCSDGFMFESMLLIQNFENHSFVEHLFSAWQFSRLRFFVSKQLTNKQKPGIQAFKKKARVVWSALSGQHRGLTLLTPTSSRLNIFPGGGNTRSQLGHFRTPELNLGSKTAKV